MHRAKDRYCTTVCMKRGSGVGRHAAVHAVLSYYGRFPICRTPVTWRADVFCLYRHSITTRTGNSKKTTTTVARQREKENEPTDASLQYYQQPREKRGRAKRKLTTVLAICHTTEGNIPCQMPTSTYLSDNDFCSDQWEEWKCAPIHDYSIAS
jgi:hypothetical protein